MVAPSAMSSSGEELEQKCISIYFIKRTRRAEDACVSMLLTPPPRAVWLGFCVTKILVLTTIQKRNLRMYVHVCRYALQTYFSLHEKKKSCIDAFFVKKTWLTIH